MIAARVRRARAKGQGGVTLLEVLISVFVISVVVIAIANGLVTTIKSDNSTNENSRLDLAMTAYAEGLKSLPYIPCGTGQQYSDAFNLQPASLRRGVDYTTDRTVETVEYWSPGTFRAPAADDTGADPKQYWQAGSWTTQTTCDQAATDASLHDHGAQRITFSVEIDHGTATKLKHRQAQVIKRNPTIANPYGGLGGGTGGGGGTTDCSLLTPPTPALVISSTGTPNVIQVDASGTTAGYLGDPATAADLGYTPLTYIWDFGNPNDSDNLLRTQSNAPFTHTYHAPGGGAATGTFTIKLKVTAFNLESNNCPAAVYPPQTYHITGPPPATQALSAENCSGYKAHHPGWRNDPNSPVNGLGMCRAGYGDLSWLPVPGATSYEIHITYQRFHCNFLCIGWYWSDEDMPIYTISAIDSSQALIPKPHLVFVDGGNASTDVCLTRNWSFTIRAFNVGEPGPWYSPPLRYEGACL